MLSVGQALWTTVAVPIWLPIIGLLFVALLGLRLRPYLGRHRTNAPVLIDAKKPVSGEPLTDLQWKIIQSLGATTDGYELEVIAAGLHVNPHRADAELQDLVARDKAVG